MVLFHDTIVVVSVSKAHITVEVALIRMDMVIVRLNNLCVVVAFPLAIASSVVILFKEQKLSRLLLNLARCEDSQ